MVDIQVIYGENGDQVYANSSPMQFSKALRLGKKIALLDNKGIDTITDFLDEESGLTEIM